MEPQLESELRKEARELGVSEVDLVRLLVNQYLRGKIHFRKASPEASPETPQTGHES
jgi:hypothetical protein